MNGPFNLQVIIVYFSLYIFNSFGTPKHINNFHTAVKSINEPLLQLIKVQLLYLLMGRNIYPTIPRLFQESISHPDSWNWHFSSNVQTFLIKLYSLHLKLSLIFPLSPKKLNCEINFFVFKKTTIIFFSYELQHIQRMSKCVNFLFYFNLLV